MTDKGRSHACMYDFALTGFETYDGTGMAGSLFILAFLKDTVGHGSPVSKRLVELDYKIVLEIIGNAADVAGSVADDAVLIRKYLHV